MKKIREVKDVELEKAKDTESVRNMTNSVSFVYRKANHAIFKE